MDAEQILAFRLARSGLAARSVGGLAEAAACPASDFTRHAALLALSARCEGVSRERYERATDAGEVVVAHVVRGAIHALAPGDLALYGRALIARNEDELAAQLGRQVQRLAAERGFAVTGALEEVAAATTDALRDGGALDKTALHDALRERVDARLLPWCAGCRSQQAPVSPGGESRGGAEGRPARGAVAGEGQGREGRDRRGAAREPHARRPRRRGAARG